VTTADLLEALHCRGVTLIMEGGRLRYRCPRGALTTELRQAVVERRDELLGLLGPQQQQGAVAGIDGRDPPARVTTATADQPRGAHRLPCCCPTAICWRCCNRPCEGCGQPTGSAFIRNCFACGLTDTEKEAP
jgi:TubC N-terminal docking domain